MIVSLFAEWTMAGDGGMVANLTSRFMSEFPGTRTSNSAAFNDSARNTVCYVRRPVLVEVGLSLSWTKYGLILLRAC